LNITDRPPGNNRISLDGIQLPSWLDEIVIESESHGDINHFPSPRNIFDISQIKLFGYKASNRQKSSTSINRLIKYSTVRILTLFLTIIVAVYLTILIVNLGGYIDEVIRSNIDEAIGASLAGGWLRDKPDAEKQQIIEQTIMAMQKGAGLNQPYLLRSLRWLGRGLTLNWGGPKWIQESVLKALAPTLILFGTANLLMFFMSLSTALWLSQKHGTWLDKAIVSLSPISSIPSWIHGVILSVIFAFNLGIFPFGKMVELEISETSLGYVIDLAWHMVLPVTAIVLSSLFSTVYIWRTFFLIHSSEDYVELAKAKGLPTSVIEKQYILRPTLPFVITNFALMLIGLWQWTIALERLFNWPGIGKLYHQAVMTLNTPLIVDLVVIFAYLLAVTLFILDFVYAMIDPRVSVGKASQMVLPISKKTFDIHEILRRRKEKRSINIERMIGIRNKLKSELKSSLDAEPDSLPGNQRINRWKHNNIKSFLREFSNYPSAVLGLVVIVFMFCYSIIIILKIPPRQAIYLWQMDANVYYKNPKNALPEWINLFRKSDLPVSIIVDDGKDIFIESGYISNGVQAKVVHLRFEYPYTEFPQDIVLYMEGVYTNKKPFIILTWLTPDGRQIDINNFSIESKTTYSLMQDDRLLKRFNGQLGQQAIFQNPAKPEPIALPGTYEMKLTGLLFEENSDVNVEMVVHGKVFGMAGTDHKRRDLMIGLQWGLPIALAFGLFGAVGTTMASITLAAIGVWFGGWLDNLIQRVCEINLIIPSFPIALMVYMLYSKSIWMVLGIMILLSIFGSSIKNYRAAFLQIKEYPYIEAAQTYGASSGRIIIHYLVPKIMPVAIPQFVILIPTYVFLESTLAFLGVSDPNLPTWGKIIYDAIDLGVFQGYYYWVLEPVILLMITGLAFALIGFALDSLYNPRLRSR
jgi:peptide/nickel transport system permease protein